MAVWSWRTMPDASVEVDRGDGSGFVRPVSDAHPQVLRTQQRVLDWAGLALDKAVKYDVPLSWILAIIYAESGGKPDADNAPACGGTGCVGLMAIHWKVHGQSRAAMLDPERNVDYGTSLLSESRRRGYDLPAAASIHVAGGGTDYAPHSGTCSSAMAHPEFPGGSPWGMCEHMFPSTQGDGAVGYIDRVVRANNSFLDLLAAREDAWEAHSAEAAPPAWWRRAAPFVGGGLVAYFAIEALSAHLRRLS